MEHILFDLYPPEDIPINKIVFTHAFTNSPQNLEQIINYSISELTDSQNRLKYSN